LKTPGKSEFNDFCIKWAAGPLNIEPSILTINNKHMLNKANEKNKIIKPISHSGHITFLNKKLPKTLNKIEYLQKKA
jgi:hypothetical protein